MRLPNLLSRLVASTCSTVLLSGVALAQNTSPLPQTGNVGIGTTTPSNALHVHDGAMRITGSNSAGGPMLILGGDPNGTAPKGQWGVEYEPNARGLNFWRPFQATNSSGSGGAPYMNYVFFMSDDNRIGINTKQPVADLTINGKAMIGDPSTVGVNTPGAYRLYVQGGILTERIKVATVGSPQWADDVFEKDYELQDLDSLSAFIDQNGHLPGIPSAKEVEQEGVDLVEINASLLRKVEELTLHLIEQNHRIKQLEAKSKRSTAYDQTPAATGKKSDKVRQ